MAPRLIRRRPLLERIKAYLNPLDFLLWLSEELDSNDWDQWQKEWANPIGVLLNVVFLIARANTSYSTRKGGDHVFGDDITYTPWLAWFVSLPPTADQENSNLIWSITGSLPCPSPFPTIPRKRHLYVLPPTALQTFRKLCGRHTKHAVRSPRPC